MISIILTSLALISCCCQAQQQQDPSKFNGGSILAMSGHNSVAIAIDSRFGLGFQTISTGLNDSSGNNNNDGSKDSSSSIINGEGNPRIIQLPNSNTLLAWSGLYVFELGSCIIRGLPSPFIVSLLPSLLSIPVDIV